MRAKILVLFLALPLLALAQNEATIGWLPLNPDPYFATLAVTDNGWLAMGFVPAASKQVSKVMLFNTAVSGSPGENDLVCDIYSSTTAGIPNSSIESRNTVTTTPVGAGSVEFTGFTATSTLTAGTQYFAVVHSLNSKSVTYTVGVTGVANLYASGGGSSTWGSITVSSTDGGSTWAGAAYPSVGIRIQYSDGTYEGTPITNVASCATRLFGTQEFGTTFTTPAGVTLNVSSIAFWVRRLGSPGNLTLKLYNNATVIASATIPSNQVMNDQGRIYTVRFAPVAVSGGTKLRVVGATSGGDSSNAYFIQSGEWSVENSAASRALLPFGGIAETACSGSCTTSGNWTDTNTKFITFGIGLSVSGEFNCGSGGSGGQKVCASAR